MRELSAIEARVIAWLAGEKWRQDVFEGGGDIYCASASQMTKWMQLKLLKLASRRPNWWLGLHTTASISKPYPRELRAVPSHKVIEKIGGIMFAKLNQIDDHIIAILSGAIIGITLALNI